jgi:hypothetical protein
MDCRRRLYLVCLPALRRCMKSGPRPDGSRRHLANGFTTPKLSQNKSCGELNAQTNPWQNISIAISSSPRGASLAALVLATVRMIVLLSLGPARLAGLPYWLAEWITDTRGRRERLLLQNVCDLSNNMNGLRFPCFVSLKRGSQRPAPLCSGSASQDAAGYPVEHLHLY